MKLTLVYPNIVFNIRNEMYQDRMCMSSETGKGFFFQVLHTSAYAGFYACFCLLFQLFDATRS